MEAVIFDFDGVIVDSERYWPAAINHAYQALVPTWKAGDEALVTGMSMVDSHKLLCERYHLDMTLEAFLDYAEGIAKQAYEGVLLMEGLKDLIAALKAKEIPFAVATSGRRQWIMPVIEHFQLEKEFEAIITAEDVARGDGKPSPTIFLKAAAALSTDPEECIVIEDSYNGIVGAKRAGMYAIALNSGAHPELDLSEADEIVTSLKEIDLKKLFA